jgi:hypothetical protein
MPRTSEPHPRIVAGNLAALPQALAPLCAQERWVIWRWTRGKNGKWTKPPFCAAQPDQHAANNDPATWTHHSTAVAAVSAGEAHGIGFALPGSDISAIDLDKCRDPETGKLDAWAQAIIDGAPGAYVETTVSGTGVRIIGTGEGAPVHRKFAIHSGREGAAIELYRGATRYITVSGSEIGNCHQVTNIDDLIDRLLAEHDRPKGNGAEKLHHAGNGLDDDIDHLIRNGAPEGQRSEAFNRVVWSLAATGASIDEIVVELERYPSGIAEKYAGRLAVEVERCWRKWAQCRSNDSPRRDHRHADRGRTAELAGASEIKPESIDWAWPNRFAFGKLALIAGDPGLGKSTILTEIAAIHSVGGSFPCGEGTARRCESIILTAEDGLADTVIPRLIAAGADLTKIHIMKGTRAPDSQRSDLFDLTRDIEALRGAFTEHPNAKILIIDPITAYLGPTTKSNENSSVRRALAPLVDLIEEFGVLAIGNNHLNKQAGKAIYRVLDSIAWVAVGRILHLIVKDAENPENRKLIVDKTNIGHKPLGLTYLIQAHDIAGETGEVIGTSRICWGTKYIDESADEAMSENKDQDPTKTEDAVEFLKIVLADGPMLTTDIEAEAKAARVLGRDEDIGQSWPFRAARKRLGVITRKTGLLGGWQWSLPEKAP